MPEKQMNMQDKEAEPSQDDKILEAVMQDDNLKDLFAGEATPLTETEETPEEDKVLEADGTEEAVDKPDGEDVDITDLLAPDGSVDLDKLKNERKSKLHAQHLIGKTAKEREEVNRLRAVEEKLRQLEAERSAQAHVAQKQAEAQTKTLSDEELNAKVVELFRAGNVVAANRLMSEHDERRMALENEVVQLKTQRAQEAQRAEEMRRREEEVAFRKAHIEDGLFDENGNIQDRERFDKMVELVQTRSNGMPIYAALPLEEIHDLAAKRLNRKTSITVDKTKQRLVASSKNNSKPVTRVTAKQHREVISGVTEDDIAAALGLKIS